MGASFLPDWLAGMEPLDVLTVMAAVAAFASVLAVWWGLIERDPMAARARALAKQRARLATGFLAPARSRHRRLDALGVMRTVTRSLDLLRSKKAEEMTITLARAGWRSKDALVAYLFFKLALPFATGGVAAAWIYGATDAPWPPAVKLLVCMTAVVAGAFAPDMAVGNQAARRRQALQKGLPDALDLLVICAEAGLSLEAALTRVAREMARSSPEVADEFALTAVELGFLPDRARALENLTRRTDMASVRGVVNTLMQTEKYGTPLAQSLRVLSHEYRDERMLKAEEKAARLPATLTVPLIMFVLPSLFVVLIGPAILRAMDSLSGYS